MKLCSICRSCYEDADTVCPLDGGPLVPSRPGTRLIDNRYRIDRLIGRGGMGAVYEGRHVDLDRPAAVKLLLPDLVSDPQALERFRREARAAARLNHPNVADTYDYGVLPTGEAYIVMEIVEGQTLRNYINASGPAPFIEAVTISRQVADGIEAAHRSGIIHRDLKPSNIILSRDHHGFLQAKVVDFGIAKLKEQTTSGGIGALTSTGSLIGTPRYMSPEQCTGQEIDARSDVYSLGIILYEMLAGRAPFDALSATAIAIKHVQEPPPPLDGLRPDVPEELSALVMRALEKSPDARPQTAAELSRTLRHIEDSLEASGHRMFPTGQAASEGHDTGSRLSPPTGTDIAAETAGHDPAETDRHDWSHQGATSRSGTPTKEEPGAPVETGSASTGGGNLRASVPPSGSETVTRAAVPPLAGPTAQSGTHPAQDDDGPVFPHTRKTARSYAPYIALIGVALLVGIGLLLLLAANRTSTSSETSASSSAMPATNSSPQAAAPSPEAPRQTEDEEQANGTNRDTPAKPEEEVRALTGALRGWVRATNSRNIAQQMSFYSPRLDVYYLSRDVPREVVQRDKSDTFARAEQVLIDASPPDITMGADGRTATMQFRKRYVIQGGGVSRQGEVLQRLVWRKTDGGWRIASEQDIQVIR